MKNSLILDKLFESEDKEYKRFHSKLVPGISPEVIIGVRTPVLRKFAKEIRNSTAADIFIHTLPHRYYEENNLHGMLLEYIEDYKMLIKELDTFLPYIDNWATCDLISPKAFKSHLAELKTDALRWTSSDKVFIKRFGIKTLMNFFLDSYFDTIYPETVSKIRSEEYYVNMAIAWYFATALAKQYDSALPYLENRALSPWVHNKTIQKAIESYRIPSDIKLYLKTLKV